MAVVADGDGGTIVEAPGVQTCALSADWIVTLAGDGRLQRWSADGKPVNLWEASPLAPLQRPVRVGVDGHILAPADDGAVLVDAAGEQLLIVGWASRRSAARSARADGIWR